MTENVNKLLSYDFFVVFTLELFIKSMECFESIDYVYLCCLDDLKIWFM
jgi:hypothetical protein